MASNPMITADLNDEPEFFNSRPAVFIKIRDFPSQFYNWFGFYKRFAIWTKLLIWDVLFNSVAKDADYDSIMLDSPYVKLHQRGCGTQKVGSFFKQSAGV